MIDLSADLLAAAEADVIGSSPSSAPTARMQRKIGRLVEWLLAIGVDCCECIPRGRNGSRTGGASRAANAIRSSNT